MVWSGVSKIPTTSSFGNKPPVMLWAAENRNTNITVAADKKASPTASTSANAEWEALEYAMVAMATAPMGNVYAHHAKENLHINQPPES